MEKKRGGVAVYFFVYYTTKILREIRYNIFISQRYFNDFRPPFGVDVRCYHQYR